MKYDVKNLNENESDLGICVAYTFEYDTCRSRVYFRVWAEEILWGGVEFPLELLIGFSSLLYFHLHTAGPVTISTRVEFLV